MDTQEDVKELFFRLNDEFGFHMGHTLEVSHINANSSFGEQVKYYRRQANLKQKDLCKRLGCSESVFNLIETDNVKLIDAKTIKGIISELDIEDKIIINDDYLSFLLGNPGKTIRDFRKTKNLSRNGLAKMLNIESCTIKRWEEGECKITRASYEKLKDYIG